MGDYYPQIYKFIAKNLSVLLLKSFIISDKNKRRTSMSSALGVEFFNKVATTLRITENK